MQRIFKYLFICDEVSYTPVWKLPWFLWIKKFKKNFSSSFSSLKVNYFDAYLKFIIFKNKYKLKISFFWSKTSKCYLIFTKRKVNFYRLILPGHGWKYLTQRVNRSRSIKCIWCNGVFQIHWRKEFLKANTFPAKRKKVHEFFVIRIKIVGSDPLKNI